MQSAVSRTLDWIETHVVRASLAKAMLLVIGCTLVAIQAMAISQDLIVSKAAIRDAASKRADAALNMLESVHTQAMTNRKMIADGDSAIATLNGTMDQFSGESKDVKLWVVMGDKIVAFQKKQHAGELETARDAVDAATLSSGEPQSVLNGETLRLTRPIKLGQGSARMKSCAGCHEGLMGINSGEVMGAYSAEVNLAPEQAVWASQARSETARSVFFTLVTIGILFLMLRIVAFRPLANLTAATQKLADEQLDAEVDYSDRPDEIGKIARALDSFRLKLIEKRSISAENNYNAYLAQHDGLTGLPNRLQFNARLDDAILAAQGSNRRVAGVIIDIDRFKYINDRHGHEAGDAVLRATASNILHTIREGEFIARMGGDEFGAWKIFANDQELEEFLDRIETALAASVTIHAVTLKPIASIGVSIWPDHTRRREQLINNADLAMYRAKADIRNKRFMFDVDMDENARRRSELVEDLAVARRYGQLSVQYQRQNNAESGEVTGYEALCRWTHPKHGAISPCEFIPLAEESGLICDIGEWVLREACATGARQSAPIIMAVNVSAIQIGDVEFPRLVHQILIDTGLAPSRLEIELTETALVQNRDRALHVLRQIKALGVQVAIDDFGVGYSSLETISLFPVDKIKIDRSFIQDIESHAKAQSLIRAILLMGDSLGIPVLAEGVETQSQLDFVRAAGCSQVQGYLFGLPCNEEDMRAYFAQVDAKRGSVAAVPRRVRRKAA